MPSNVTSLLATVVLEADGCVHWEEPVAENRAGVYIVALTSATDKVNCLHATAPLSDTALDDLLAVCPDLTLDDQRRPTRGQLAERIGSYWLRDECVLYIGLAGQPLRTRVRQYYKTPLGAAKPHRGGWWLKTLSALGDCTSTTPQPRTSRRPRSECCTPSPPAPPRQAERHCRQATR